MRAPQLDRAQRRQRRETLAAVVVSGASVRAVSRAFGVRDQTVYSACKEFGVLPGGKPGRPRATREAPELACLRLIALLVNSPMPYTHLAEKFALDTASVEALATQLTEAGFTLPARSHPEETPKGETVL